ncbi:MAG: hypothetical protein ABFE08_22400 [Armatimonadia bacterium]
MEQVIIGIIVLVAAWYVVRNLTRAWRGKTACQEDMCIGCAFKDSCGHVPQTPVTQSKDNEEIRND